MATRKQKYADDTSKDARSNPLDEKQLRRTLCIGTLGGIVFILLLTWLTLSGWINLSGRANASQLWDASYYHRLEFTIRYQILGIGWLYFNAVYVMYRRLRTRAVNPLAPGEEAVFEANKILTNSVEQFLLSFFAQVISISYLDEQLLLKLIPLVNLLFIIGRITFFLGYPIRRTFGFTLTWIPTSLLLVFSLVSFVRFLFCN